MVPAQVPVALVPNILDIPTGASTFYRELCAIPTAVVAIPTYVLFKRGVVFGLIKEQRSCYDRILSIYEDVLYWLQMLRSE